MKMSSVPIPEVYKQESADFRFFLKWFELALTKIHHDTEEFMDLYDPLRCPEQLLWMLGDTMGYKYDNRLSPAFNRLAILYFMSMIRLKGSRDGLTLAAQVNLNQFKLQELASTKDILNNRLEDTSVPSNAIFIEPHPDEGYIDLIYFSDQLPVDACTEYVRPIGMYVVPHAGVRYDAKTRICIDARLTNINDLNISIGPTHVGHYSYNDYSRLQRLSSSDLTSDGHVKDTEGIRRSRRSSTSYDTLSDTREPVWYRNSKYEGTPSTSINPGYRALYSLQLANGSESTRSLTGIRNITELPESDIGVFDTDGNVYDQEYFETENARRSAVPEYVEPRVMGSFGDAMMSNSGESGNDTEILENDPNESTTIEETKTPETGQEATEK